MTPESTMTIARQAIEITFIVSAPLLLSALITGLMVSIFQAATHQLKSKLPDSYKNWTAQHTAQQVLTNMEGDIRVENDKIIVTYYRDHENLNLKNNFENLPQILQAEGVNPKIPWLFDFMLDFRFK